MNEIDKLAEEIFEFICAKRGKGQPRSVCCEFNDNKEKEDKK